MTTTEKFGINEETTKFLIGIANYPSANKLAKLFVADSFRDVDEAQVFINEMEVLCELAFRFSLGNVIDPEAIDFRRDMGPTRGFHYVYPQPVSDWLNETFEPEYPRPEIEEYCNCCKCKKHSILSDGSCSVPCNRPIHDDRLKGRE